MNTRLQVEHPVTEAVTGVDLVRVQILAAEGASLPFAQEDVHQRGHAIEARLYAEDPARGHLPATGRLHAFVPAEAEGVRWDSGVDSGSVVSSHYDPMLAKAIAHAETRDEAARLLAWALERTVVHGVATNRRLLVAILRDDAFLAGETTTAFLDERFPTDDARRLEPDDGAVRDAAVVAALEGERRRAEARRTQATIPSGWRVDGSAEQEATYRTGERTLLVRYRRERDGTFAVRVGDEAVRVRRSTSGYEIDGRLVRPLVSRAAHPVNGEQEVHIASGAAQVTLREMPRFQRSAAERLAGATLAPMPGAVVSVAVSSGDEVEAGQLLVTVEAMKMEHRVTAPLAGRVAEVRVAEGQQVEAGEILVVLDDAT
jgi:propionyl-CoA carboxylase alpha chain